MTQSEIEQLWAEHLKAEFVTKDAEAALATMLDDATVDHVPVHTGGSGRSEILAFYQDNFIPSWPDDTKMEPLNRIIGENQLADEIRISFTHSRRMDWFLPGVEPTGKPVQIDVVVVVQFRADKIACERIYWDQATVLRQVS